MKYIFSVIGMISGLSVLGISGGITAGTIGIGSGIIQILISVGIIAGCVLGIEKMKMFRASKRRTSEHHQKNNIIIIPHERGKGQDELSM